MKNRLSKTSLPFHVGLSIGHATAQLMVSNRLIEPLSEWALIDWSHRTALPELLGIRITKSATPAQRGFTHSNTTLGDSKSSVTRTR